MEKANGLTKGKARSLERRSQAILAVIAALGLATVAAIGLDMHVCQTKRADDIRTFQRAVGGLGMGSIASPVWQFINYDARIFPLDDSITWPIPGGYSYGPDRTGTVSYFEETPENQWIRRKP